MRPDEAQAFVGEFDEQVTLLVLAVPTADEVDALQCCYHFDDLILVHLFKCAADSVIASL